MSTKSSVRGGLLMGSSSTNSKEYLWVLTSRVLAAHSRAMVEGCKIGLKFMSLHDKSLIDAEANQSEVEHCIERRYLPRTSGIVIITEKEAVISFLLLMANQTM